MIFLFLTKVITPLKGRGSITRYATNEKKKKKRGKTSDIGCNMREKVAAKSGEKRSFSNYCKNEVKPIVTHGP